MKTSAELEEQAALQVASLMAAAARTAPKTRGIDNIKVVVIDDEPAKQQLITKMREIASKESRASFARDAGNIENAPAVVVIGVAANTAVDIDVELIGIADLIKNKEASNRHNDAEDLKFLSRVKNK